MGIQVHLVDGTYELFRHFYGARRAAADNTAGVGGPEGTGSGASAANPQELAGVRGVLFTVLQMLETGATHLGVATDHVIESFRNDLWPGYKTGAGIDPQLRAQFGPLESALEALGVRVWAMVDVEADDALAAAAYRAARDERVEKVCIWTPDKDLSQCVRGQRVVQIDRRSGTVRDQAGVVEKFGVPPESIPDYLALVGDSADGFPGLPGWGAKSAARVLARYRHIEAIPERAADWDIRVVSAPRLAATLSSQRADALLFRQLATLRTDVPVFDDVEQLRWRGATSALVDVAEAMGAPELSARAHRVAEEGGGSRA